MDRRTPLQHLLHTLLPPRGLAETPTPDFMDTRPDDTHAAPATRQAAPPRKPRAWAESALDLELGTDIMEYPDDTAADLMDEFFAKSEKRAA